MQRHARVTVRTKLVSVVSAATLLLVATAPPAGAALRLDAGGGTAPTVGGFAPVQLNGSVQLTTASISPFLVIDDTGNLAGWNVTLLVPDFRNGTGPDCTTNATASISATTLSMDAPVVAPADGQTSMTGVTSAGFTDFTSVRTIIDAAVTDGAGTYTVSPQILRLTVPVSTLSGTYCTAATIAIASGP